MKLNKGFTLIEIIGVLAVIVILAAIAGPKIGGIIKDSKVAQTVELFNGVKGAIVDYTRTNSSLPVSEAIMQQANVLDGAIVSKIGTASYKTFTVVGAGTAAPIGDGKNFDFDGDAQNDLTVGSKVAVLEILTVSANQALQLSNNLDGTALTETTATTADVKGRVVYAAPTAGVATVYLYFADE